MKRPSTNHGFAAMIALLLGVVIIAFIMVQQYGGFQFFNRQSPVHTGDDSSSGIRAPIDRAREVKEMLEAKNRESMEQ